MSVKIKMSYTILINVLLVVIAFTTSIIMTNILGPEGFGQYKYIITVAFTLSLFTSYGLPDMLNVKLARKFINLKDYICSALTGVMPVYIIIGSILFYYLFARDNITDKPLTIIALLYCLVYQLNHILQQTIHSLDKLLKFQLFEITKQLVFLCGAIIFAFIHSLSIIHIFEILIFANMLAIVYVVYLFFTTDKDKKMKLAFSKELIQNSFKAFTNNVLTFVTTKVDIFILKYAGLGFYEIGIYTLAITLVEKLWIIPESIRTVLYLELSNQRKGDDFVAKIIRLLVVFSLLIGVIIAFLAIFIIPFVFGERFRASILPFLFLLPGAIFFCYIKILGTYFVVREMLTINTYMTSIIAVVNITLCIILIPQYSYYGAAIAKTFAYIIGSIYHVNKFRIVSGTNLYDLIIMKKTDIMFIIEYLKKLINGKK